MTVVVEREVVGVRVSDWRATPQCGIPREEYSGKRDPAAPERSPAERRDEPGHAQKQAHREVMLISNLRRVS